jgi:hypothetical protein
MRVGRIKIEDTDGQPVGEFYKTKRDAEIMWVDADGNVAVDAEDALEALAVEIEFEHKSDKNQ